jgi:tetratricopeptide (TPR) repeat protein
VPQARRIVRVEEAAYRPSRTKAQIAEDSIMAKKLNKKLVFVVGAATVSLGALFAFGLMWRLDTERFIRAGDKLVAEGDFRKATEAYGRAVNKKQNNIAYLEKFSGAMVNIVPETQNEANERYQQYIASLQLLARADRDNVERWRTYLEAVIEQCEGMSSSAAWKNLSDRCDEALNTVRAGGAEEQVLKAYRGFAGMRRLDSLDEPQRLKIVEDLKAAAASKDLTAVERDRVLGSLARIAIDDYARARGAGRADRLEAADAAAAAAMAAALAECPDGVVTATAALERSVLDSNGELDAPAVAEKAGVLAAKALASGRPMTIYATTSTLVRSGPAGLEQGVGLLRDFLAKYPDEILHRRVLASVLRFRDREAALAEIQKILDAKRPKVGLLAASFEANRADAAILRFDLLYDGVIATEGEERKKGIERLVETRNELAKTLEGSADDSSLLRIDGKISAARGDFANAVIKYNEVFKKGSAVDLELYIIAAFANLELGETGRALDLLNGGMQLSPGNAQILKMRVNLEMRTGRVRDAIETIALLKERAPNDPDVAQLEQMVLAVREADPASGQGRGNTESIDALARVQAAVDAKDFDGARRLLDELRKASPAPSIAIERFAIAVEVQAGDADAARRMIDSALIAFPQDPSLQRFRALFASDDPVERVVILTEGTIEEQPLRTIVTYLRLLQSEIAIRQTAERETRLGLATAPATRATLARLEAGVKEWRAKADAADRTHPILLEADFRDAIDRKDFATATGIVAIARESKRDPAQSVLFESQLLAAQGKMREATNALEGAIQSGIDSSVVFRALGSMLEQVGNIESAQRQYEEAYKRRPDDMQTVRQLVGALVRGGNTQRALEVLREARQLAGLDNEVSEVWLGLEAQLGDRKMAMRMRENQYRVAPGDTRNALSLANLLSSASPDRPDVVNERGQESYNEQQWAQLESAARFTALERTRAQWRKRAEEIFRDATRREPGNLDLASSFSQLLRILGRRDEAVTVMSAAVGSAGEAAGWRGHVILGSLLLQLGRDADARAAFAEAVRREDPKTRDASRSIIDVAFDAERFAVALEYLEPIARASDDRGLKLRLAEVMLRAGSPEDARRTFDAAVQGATRDVAMEMLDGAIAMATGDQMRASGRIAEAKAAYEGCLAPYARAKTLAPFAPQPFMQDAMAKRKLFELTGEQTRGQEALAAADRAVALGGATLAASATRSEILLAVGDVNGAVGELERFLRISPTSIEARRRLVEIHERTGSLDRAEDAIRSAISLMPGDPAWHIALGDLMIRRARFADAAASFERADLLQPMEDVFFRELNARVRAKDYRGVVATSRRRPELVRVNPTARTYVGVALVGGDERAEGIRTLTESYREARAAFDGGDPRLLGQWYEAVSLLYTPATLADAEGLFRQLANGTPDVLGSAVLADLAMGNQSAGAAKAVEYLAGVKTYDFKSMPQLGAQMFDRLGSLLYVSGDCAGAVKAFEQGLAYAPTSDALLNNYAYLCGDCLKDAKKGLESARLAVQLNPTRSEYLDTLGSLLILDGKHAEALDVLGRASTLANGAAVQYHLAQAYNALGRSAEARAAIESAQKLNPDPQTRAGIEQLLKELK